MRRFAFILSLFGLLATAVTGGLFFTGVAGSNEDDKGILATIISKALSSPGMIVSVGAVDGALSSDATIRDITIADATGPWLKLDQARLVWTRSALLLGRLSVDRLEIGKLEILRKPLRSTESAPAPDGPLLPELPVKVEIAAFTLADLAISADVVGASAHLSAQGKVKLGNPAEGLDLTLDLRRTDAVGAINLNVSLVPDTTALKLKFAVHETAGGLLARTIDLPDLPPVDFDLDGEGRLDAFSAKLIFQAGANIGASGGATLTRQGLARVLSLDAMARIEGLLPNFIAPVFADETRLAGKIHLGDDSSYRIEDFTLAAKAGRIDIGGRIGPDKSIEGCASLRASHQPGRVEGAAAQIRTLNLDASAKGFLQAPQVAARLLIEDASLPQGVFRHVQADIALNPDGPVLNAATRSNLSIDATGEGLSFADKALAAAIGDRFKIVVRGKANAQGDADLSVARATLQTLDVQFTGKAGPNLVDGRMLIDAPDLSRFGALAGLKLQGAFKATADIAGDPAARRIGAAMALSGQKIKTGLSALDPLLGGKLDLDGELDFLPNGGFRFTEFTIDGRHIAARIHGEATRTDAGVSGKITIADASKAFDDVSGRAEADFHLSGSLTRPDLSAALSITDARAMGRLIPRLSLKADARDIFGNVEAHAVLDGLVGRNAARGLANLTRNAQGRWAIATDNLAVGEARITAGLNIVDAKFINGQVTLKAPDLDELSPLLMHRMAGRIDADIKFDTITGKQNLAIKAIASGIRAPSVAVDRLDADARMRDLYGTLAIDGVAAIDRAIVAGETLSRLRMSSKNAGSGNEIAFAADLRGIALDARGTLSTGDRQRVLLASLNARKGSQKITLARPASFELSENRLAVSSLALNAGAGRLTIDGHVGQALDLAMTAKSFPLTFASLVNSSLQLDGLLDAEARVMGSADAPTGKWQVRIAKLNAPQIRSAGLPPLQINGTGQMNNGRTSIQAAIDLGKGGRVTVNGMAPFDNSTSLDIKIAGMVDAALANTSLAASGRSLSGRISIDARAEGALARPRLAGTASLTGGSFWDPLAGVKLEKITATARAQGENIAIEQASAITRNGGTINVSGNIRAAPDAGFPANIRISANNAELVSSSLVRAVADVALDLSGPLARNPRLSGRITLDSMDVNIPEKLPINNSALANARHIDPTRAVTQRLALEKAARKKTARSAPFTADVDINLSAPARIFVRGRGIDAELGGDLRLTGTLDRPVAIGGFELRRGRIDVASQRLDFTKGQVKFNGDLTPELDFIAQTSAGDATAQVGVSGAASDPKFAFTSTPVLPQDEVISRLLFARASGSLTAVQALQLAQTVAELSGEGGPSVFSKLRKSLGVDSLDVRMGADGQPTIGASRYISRNVSVGVRTGAKPEDSAVSFGVDVTRRLKAQGEMGADGKASVGVGFEWEY